MLSMVEPFSMLAPYLHGEVHRAFAANVKGLQPQRLHEARPKPNIKKGGAVNPVADKNLTCRDCGKTFAFTEGEQEFYKSRGLMNEPQRCPDCRSAKRQERSRGGGGPREMFTVTCAQCGKETQVPFQPKQDRPVYCSDCYSKQKARR